MYVAYPPSPLLFFLTHTALTITIPSFDGSSYITYPPLPLTTSTLTLTLNFIPSAPDGLLLFTSTSENNIGSYLSIALVNSYVEFRYNLGSGVATITSAQALQLDSWYTVTVQLSGTNGTLFIDNLATVFGQSSPPLTGLNARSSLWLGGYTNFINVSSITGTNHGFIGCIRSLRINNIEQNLILDAMSGFGVGMCNSSSSCQSSPCFNGGSCIESGSSFVCECASGYSGSLCGSSVDPCAGSVCPAGSTCQSSADGLTFTCLCPLGRGGDNCDQGEESCLAVA